MSDRKRILYLMHVDWAWIKQRPHFIAEGLSERYEILALYKPNISQRKQLPRVEGGLRRLPLFPLPGSNRTGGSIYSSLQKLRVRNIAADFQPDLIWITHPILLTYVPSELSKLPVIYDCMDDVLAFTNTRRQSLLTQFERQLVKIASKLFCSSENLANVICSRYGTEMQRKIVVVRNAVSQGLLLQANCSEPASPSKSNKGIVMAYAGTVGEWFDFDTILQCLRNVPTSEMHVFGPIEVKNPPQHPRLSYHAPIAHSMLANRLSTFDILVMPFRMSPLIASVDPVKLYEYLALGKEVIAIGYREIERFEPFLHFYQTPDQFTELVTRIMQGTGLRKNVPETVYSFLQRNTWTSRLEQLFANLEGLV